MTRTTQPHAAMYNPGVRSMTGFGRGVAEHARHARDRRHSLRQPPLPRPQAPRLARAGTRRGDQPARARGGRARLDLGARFTSLMAPAPRRSITAAAGAAHVQLAELARTLGLPAPDLALVLAQPGVVVTRGDDDLPHASILAAHRRRARAAAADARRRRRCTRERARPRGSPSSRSAPRNRSRRSHARSPESAARAPARARSTSLDRRRAAARLAQEVALLADRADVTEELVRLASHLEQARKLVAGQGAVGRRLDFLVQELGRELNTIGSKSALAEITALDRRGESGAREGPRTGPERGMMAPVTARSTGHRVVAFGCRQDHAHAPAARGVSGRSWNSRVSYTTRPMRPGEVDGRDYWFVTPDDLPGHGRARRVRRVRVRPPEPLRYGACADRYGARRGPRRHLRRRLAGR